MDFRDAISALLPPPRDDEPAGLRQDIIDELGDHIAAAYNRELLRGADSAVARQRVLERFGDPAAVARRLWFDAMKGKIMAQRVLIATGLVVMLCCSATCALAWNWMNQDRLLRGREAAESIAANRRMAEALAQAQATNKDMLARLGEMSEAIRHPRSPDWNPVVFKLTEETPSGPPVAKANLSLIRSGENPPKTIQRTSDASGLADFGAVQPGDYSFSIYRHFPEGDESTSGELNVRPGSEVHKSIVCPKAPPEKMPVRIKCAWPADLETAGLDLYATFRFSERALDQGLSWTLHDVWKWDASIHGMGGGMTGRHPLAAARSVLCGAGGSASAETAVMSGLTLWTTESPAQVLGGLLERDLHELIPPDHYVKWEPGTYRLAELIVVRPAQGSVAERGTRLFDVLVKSSLPNFQRTIFTQKKAPLQEFLTMMQPQIVNEGFGGGPNTIDPIPKEFWGGAVGHFEARPGQVNEWTIPLPDELVNAVRTAIKAKPSAKPKPAGPAASVERKS